MRRLILFLLVVQSMFFAVPAAAAPFTDNGNSTVTDIRTGLVWQQDEPGYMSWGSALSYCEGLSLGNNTGWRLPNVKELESLTDDTRYNPAIDTNYFPGAHASSYWSSTTNASYPSSRGPSASAMASSSTAISTITGTFGACGADSVGYLVIWIILTSPTRTAILSAIRQ